MDLGVECFQVEFGFRGLWVRIWGVFYGDLGSSGVSGGVEVSDLVVRRFGGCRGLGCT